MAGATYQADVIVVGGGIAGIAATLELLEAGKRVLLLDRDRERRLGGIARESFGGIFVVSSSEQRRSGIRDSPDLALRDWLSHAELGAEDVWPRRWAEAYTSRCHDDVYRWLKGCSVKFLPMVNWTERGLFKPGNSVPRFHVVWGLGKGLIDALLARLGGHRHRDRLTLAFEHRVEQLVTKAGTVTGCCGVRESDGQPFVADGDAVIIAAGGIMGNLERVRADWYRPWGDPPEVILNGAHRFADGRLHDAAAAAGGAVTHLDKMWTYASGVHDPQDEQRGLSIVPPKSALWVDWQGRRIGPTPLVTGFDARYLVEAVCRQPKKYSWQVMNWKIATKELVVSGTDYNQAYRDKKIVKVVLGMLLGVGRGELIRGLIDRCRDFVEADSLAELVRRMNQLQGSNDIDPDVLAAEVSRYDGSIGRGPKLWNDDQLRRIAHARRWRVDRMRTCKFQPIDDPHARPLIAVRQFVVTRKSLGGIQTDLDCRVLDHTGEPIPNLFAVGEAAGFGGGGVHGLRALEGSFLGSCVLTGRVAGQAIARG